MTGTLHGYMIYRFQDELRRQGHNVNYDVMSESLSNVLMQLDNDVKHGEFIELPTGNGFIKHDFNHQS